MFFISNVLLDNYSVTHYEILLNLNIVNLNIVNIVNIVNFVFYAGYILDENKVWHIVSYIVSYIEGCKDKIWLKNN